MKSSIIVRGSEKRVVIKRVNTGRLNKHTYSFIIDEQYIIYNIFNSNTTHFSCVRYTSRV